jgi:Dolichol-phosphate mannosyltransferase subunit 3 (DPM3)
MNAGVWAFLGWFGALTALLCCDCTRKELSADPYHSWFFFVLTLPLYAIVMFGCHALINIGWHLFTLRDCDEAYHELLGQIKQAREELSKKGLKFNK